MKNVKNKLRKIVVSAVIASIVLPMGSGISFTSVVKADAKNIFVNNISLKNTIQLPTLPATPASVYQQNNIRGYGVIVSSEKTNMSGQKELILSKEATAEDEAEVYNSGMMSTRKKYVNNYELSNLFVVADGDYDIKYVDLDGNEYSSKNKAAFDEKMSDYKTGIQYSTYLPNTYQDRAESYATILASIKARGNNNCIFVKPTQKFREYELAPELYEELKSYSVYEYTGYMPMRDSKHPEAREAWNTMRQILKDAPKGDKGVEYGYSCYIPNLYYTEEDIKNGNILRAEDTQCVCVMLYRPYNSNHKILNLSIMTTHVDGNNTYSLLPLHGMGTTLKSSYNIITGKTEKATIFEYNHNEIITSEDDKRNLTDRTNEATWTSSNEDIISVENGVIKAKKQGTATITVTYGDCSYSSKVTSYKKNKKPAKKVYKSTKGKDVTLKLNDYTGVAHIQWMTRKGRYTKAIVKKYPKVKKQDDYYEAIKENNRYVFNPIKDKTQYNKKIEGAYVFDENHKRMNRTVQANGLYVLKSNLKKSDYASYNIGSPLVSYVTAYMDKNNTICKLKISKSAYKRFKKRYNGEKTWEYSYTYGLHSLMGTPIPTGFYCSDTSKYKGKDLSTKNIYAKVTYLDGTIEMIPFTYVLTK